MAGDGWDNAPIPMTFSSYAGNLGPLLYYTNTPDVADARDFLLHRLARASPPAQLSVPPSSGLDHRRNEQHHALWRACPQPDRQDRPRRFLRRSTGGPRATTATRPTHDLPAQLLQWTLDRNDPNDPANKISEQDAAANNFAITATSQHPGGCNFAFCDGSVRFIKDSINSWNPRSSFTPDANYTTVPAEYGVYQSLSTRNGGEVISADSY